MRTMPFRGDISAKECACVRAILPLEKLKIFVYYELTIGGDFFCLVGLI